MKVICERCCGLDIHKSTITACVIIGKKGDSDIWYDDDGGFAGNDVVSEKEGCSDDSDGKHWFNDSKSEHYIISN